MDRQSGENLSISAGGLLVNYDDNGPRYAPPVVFVHGTPFDKGIWELQAEALKSNYRVISYDLRGHGKTPDPGENFSIQLFADDLIRFLDALDIRRAILCGISLGSHIVLDAVNRYPHRFDALVLAGAKCAADTHDMKAERDRLVNVLHAGGVEKYVDEAMKNWFASNSFVARKEEVRSVRRMSLRTNVMSVQKTLSAMSARKETCSNLSSISCPVLILTGREDEVAPPEAATFMRDNIPGSEMHLIDYAGHLANLENTHEFNTILRRFIDKVCESRQLSRHCDDESQAEIGKSLTGKTG